MENFSEEELPDKESRKIRDIYKDSVLPAETEQLIINKLKGLKLIRSSATYYLKMAAVIILIPLLFIAGYFIGKNDLKSTNMNTNETSTYLLLLYQPKNFIANEAAHVKEYGAWLKDLQKEGKMESGEKLRNKSWLISAAGTESFTGIEMEKGVVSGFFIVKATSDDEALKVANTCPHLKYNGLIEVRPIEHTH